MLKIILQHQTEVVIPLVPEYDVKEILEFANEKILWKEDER